MTFGGKYNFDMAMSNRGVEGLWDKVSRLCETVQLSPKFKL